jgi:hypothetical protein
METNPLGSKSGREHSPRRYDEQEKRVNADDTMGQEAPCFSAGYELCHQHPGYREEHCDPKDAEAFIERPSASFRKPCAGMEEHNGERSRPP